MAVDKMSNVAYGHSHFYTQHPAKLGDIYQETKDFCSETRHKKNKDFTWCTSPHFFTFSMSNIWLTIWKNF